MPNQKFYIAILAIAALAVLYLGFGQGESQQPTQIEAPRTTAQPNNNAGLLPTMSTETLRQAPPVFTPEPTYVGTVPAIAALAGDNRIVIPSVDIEAPLYVSQVGSDGVMPDPRSAHEVVLYDFSLWQGLGGAIGKGGNTVLSGHLDSATQPCNNGKVPPPCTAVFWNLGDTEIGEEVQIHLGKNTYRYKVISSQMFLADSKVWNYITSATQEEMVTLITCDGSFVNGEYTHRRVVRAIRVN